MTPTAKAAKQFRLEKRIVKRLKPKYWRPEPSIRAPLTPREFEVAILLAQGYSYTNISAKLEIAEKTAECHAHHLYRKLGIHSRAELIHLMFLRGWVSNIYGDPEARRDEKLAPFAGWLLDMVEFVEQNRRAIELIAVGPDKHPYFVVKDKTA